MNTVNIHVSYEATLTINSEGIVDKFAAFFEEKTKQDPDDNFRLEESDVFKSDRHTSNYRVGLLEVSHKIGPDMSDWHGGINPKNHLWIHIFPNVPMQDLNVLVGQLLEGMGVEEFEAYPQWYLNSVKTGIEFLESGKPGYWKMQRGEK